MSPRNAKKLPQRECNSVPPAPIETAPAFVRISQTKKNLKLIRFIKENKSVLDHLVGVMSGRIQSVWRDRFNAQTKKFDVNATNARTAPILDYGQQEEICTWLNQQLESLPESKVKPKAFHVSYVILVWYPEALFFALQRLEKLSSAAAFDIVDTPLADLIDFEQKLSRSRNSKKNAASRHAAVNESFLDPETEKYLDNLDQLDFSLPSTSSSLASTPAAASKCRERYSVKAAKSPAKGTRMKSKKDE